MRLKTISIVVVAFMLSACAATLTDRAAKIQVHSQISTLLSTCQKLGQSLGMPPRHGLNRQCKRK